MGSTFHLNFNTSGLSKHTVGTAMMKGKSKASLQKLTLTQNKTRPIIKDTSTAAENSQKKQIIGNIASVTSKKNTNDVISNLVIKKKSKFVNKKSKSSRKKIQKNIESSKAEVGSSHNKEAVTLEASERNTNYEIPNSGEQSGVNIVSENGIMYEGSFNGKEKHGHGKLIDKNNNQFIEGDWENDCLVKIHYSQFKINETDYVRIYGLNNLYCSSKDNFVARFNTHSFKIGSNNFPDIQKEIESGIVITKILDDDLRNNLQTSRKELKCTLKAIVESVTENDDAKHDMFYLHRLISNLNYNQILENQNDNITLLNKISSNTLLSEEIRNRAKITCFHENRMINREEIFLFTTKSESFLWNKIILEYVNNSILRLKDVLLRTLPSSSFLPLGFEDINKLQECRLFACYIQDIKLFSDLELTIHQHFKTCQLDVNNFYDFTRDYIKKLWCLFITTLNNSVLNKLESKSPYTNPVFLQLCKTFIELLTIVGEDQKDNDLKVVDILPNNDIYYSENQKDICSATENRLKFIITLLNHFKPGQMKTSLFKYEFSLFETNTNIFKLFQSFFTHSFDKSLDDICQEYVIWLYYVHKNFSHQVELQKEEANKHTMNSFLNSLLDLFKGIIKNCDIPFEKVRILANNIIKFGCTISPLFLKQSFVDSKDLTILLKMAECMKDFVTKTEGNINDVTNIVDAYQVFWDERWSLFSELREHYSFWSTTEELIEKFNKFTEYMFSMRNYTGKFLKFLRSFNEYLRFLRATKFPWYVKKDNIVTESYIKIEDKNTDTYLVQDPEKYYKELLDNSQNVPRHYFFYLTNYFLNCAENFLLTNHWDEHDKIQAASELFLLMARSLINFEKLSKAFDFNHFYEIFTNPFDRVIENSNNVTNFIKRLNSLENFYKYTMELNVMSVDKALELCEQTALESSFLDCSFKSEQLKIAYKIYLDKFNSYVEKYILQPNFVVDKLVEKAKMKVKPKDVSKWSPVYKITELPKLLAGLSAVWTALESEDVIHQKQVIKPHCIQILCLLRLMGVDQSRDGFENHLAQVLTGQGKSIILSFLAAVLALTGNRVRIVCYNTYLAERDAKIFKAFYKIFSIEHNVNYGTFEEMANEIYKFKTNEMECDFRAIVEKLITDELPKIEVSEEESLVSKPILLIDEVDVFFSSKFYGNVFRPCAIICSKTVADLQIKIWNLSLNNHNVSTIQKHIQQYIDNLQHTDDCVFEKLLIKSRNILDCHVKTMIIDAINVHETNSDDCYFRTFRLDDDGCIFIIDNNGTYIHHSYSDYENVFMYFKLKETDFDHKNFSNYGYLVFDVGQISYALLPNDYRGIVGVTGTLQQLSSVEMRTVTSYNITRGSIMPTFFGATNKLVNFTIIIEQSEDDWITAILNSIVLRVEEDRAVIVFFENEHEIETVRSKFKRHLSRYSVLTGNESSQQVADCVDEAGVARTVTLTTRHMGRGVDFKSNDSHVEAKGGIHVIQTFFSIDVKEEIQIKGRTARKDNNGSYQLILCRDHLERHCFLKHPNSYEELNAARILKAENERQNIEENIQKSKRQHEDTLNFIKSFYNYDPANRNAYFQKYPFIEEL